VAREIVVLNAITTATTHKNRVASLQIFMSSHFIGSDSTVASHQRGIAIVGFIETQLEDMTRKRKEKIMGSLFTDFYDDRSQFLGFAHLFVSQKWILNSPRSFAVVLCTQLDRTSHYGRTSTISTSATTRRSLHHRRLFLPIHQT
jgi:hypothetical protein